MSKQDHDIAYMSAHDGGFGDPVDPLAPPDAIRIVAVPLCMRDPDTSAAIAGAAL